MKANQLTSNDSKAVDDANSPELVNHLQRYSNQQLKYQVSYDVCIATTATNISSCDDVNTDQMQLLLDEDSRQSSTNVASALNRTCTSTINLQHFVVSKQLRGKE